MSEHEPTNEPPADTELVTVNPETPAQPPSPSSQSDVDATSDNRSRSHSLTGSFAMLPTHLKHLARQIRRLGHGDLLVVTEMTQRAASREVYSLMQYSGGSWYLPEIRACTDTESPWGIGITGTKLHMAIAGRHMEISFMSYLVRLTTLVLFWFVLWDILGEKIMEPGGVVWDPLVTILVSSVVGGLLCRIAHVPPLIGVLWIAIMWHRIPDADHLTHGIIKELPKIAAKLGITFILARAGFSLTLKVVLPTLKLTLLLSSLPLIIESITHAFIANRVFNYADFNWAFAQGFACSIVSPAIVVPGVLFLQEQGYGRGTGPLTLMLSSCGIETACGVWTVNFIFGLIFSDQSLGLAIALGPIQFLIGIILGVVLGLLFNFIVELMKAEADRLPDGRLSRAHFEKVMDTAFGIFIMIATGVIFYCYAVSYAGGGAICVIVFSSTVSHLWIMDGVLEKEDQKKHIGSLLSSTWDLLVMPFLFSMVGATIEVEKIFNATFFPKAILIVCCSGVARMITIFLLQYKSGLTVKEKILVCAGYCGKAGSQASLGPLALSLATSKFGGLSNIPPDVLEKCNNVKYMTVLYILVYAPFAAISLVKGGARVCKKS